jgi:SAM-dependent methyltransferase
MTSYASKGAAYFGNVRREIEPLLPTYAARVLDVGCGGGCTLGWLKASGRAGTTVGIELAEAAAAQARSRVDELHVGDATVLIDVLPQASFDLVLCLDVLEHLVDPWEFAARLPWMMKPGALLVASVPNVRHLEVVLPLLLRGQWRYARDGLLDRTHLRFFTREGVLALLSPPGLHVERWCHRIHPWPSKTGWVNVLTLGLMKDFLAINFLVAARRT